VLAAALPEDLAERLADLGRLPAGRLGSPQRILAQVVELVAAAAPGGVSASAGRWVAARDGWEPEVVAASHPDAAWLDHEELMLRAGPALAALAADGPVDVPDVLADRHRPGWAGWATAAAAAGVRSVLALVRPVPDGRLTLTLHGVRPGSLLPDDAAVATLVLAQAATALGNAERYGEAHRAVHQLTEALRGRSVIEQAKGVLMHATGCDADAAFAELRRRSQAANLRLGVVAARVVADAAAADPVPDRRSGVPPQLGGYRFRS
jgi:GAF domain-containing protein